MFDKDKLYTQYNGQGQPVELTYQQAMEQCNRLRDMVNKKSPHRASP